MTNRKTLPALVLMISFFLGQSLFGLVPMARANALTSGSLSVGDSRPSQTGVTYTMTFSNVDTTTAIKCVEVEFATTAAGGTIPTDMSLASAAVNASSTYITGLNGWSKTVSGGKIQYTDVTGATPGGASGRTVVLDEVANGSVADTGYYAIFNTYTDANCTAGNEVDYATVKFIYTDGQVVSLTVDPFLSFTITGVAGSQSVNGATTTVATVTDANTIPLGTVTAATNAIAAHDLNVGTNSTTGYSVYVRYTGKPTYSTADIDDHSGTHTVPTIFPQSVDDEDFGYTTNDADLTQFATNKWAAFTASNEVVATRATPTSGTETTRVGYQVGVSSSTPAGNYTTTVIYTATPTY